MTPRQKPFGLSAPRPQVDEFFVAECLSDMAVRWPRRTEVMWVAPNICPVR